MQTVPVEAARQIGQTFEKDVVVILAWDCQAARTDVVTWGRDAGDKLRAADAGPRCAEAFGCDLSTQRTHQDYRYQAEGDRAAIVDALVRACRAADQAIASVMATRHGISDELLADVRRTLQQAMGRA